MPYGTFSMQHGSFEFLDSQTRVLHHRNKYVLRNFRVTQLRNNSLRASSLAWAQGLGEGEGGGKGKERELAAMSHKFECRLNAPRGSALSKLSEFGQSAQTGNER